MQIQNSIFSITNNFKVGMEIETYIKYEIGIEIHLIGYLFMKKEWPLIKICNFVNVCG